MLEADHCAHVLGGEAGVISDSSPCIALPGPGSLEVLEESAGVSEAPFPLIVLLLQGKNRSLSEELVERLVDDQVLFGIFVRVHEFAGVDHDGTYIFRQFEVLLG